MKKIAILIATVLTLGGFSTSAYATGVDTQTTQTTQVTQTTQTTPTTQETQTTSGTQTTSTTQTAPSTQTTSDTQTASGTQATTGTQTTSTTQTTPSTQATTTTQTADSTVVKEQAGVTPDSLLYAIDKAVDQLRLMLANTEEKKAEVNADIAQERLSESQVMTEEGKVELALKALEDYNAKITEASKLLQEVVVNLQATAVQNTDTTATNSSDTTTVNGSNTAVDENTDKPAEDKLEQSISNLEKAIQDVQAQSLVVLGSLKDIAPEKSTEIVKEAIEEQTNHKELVANFVKERHEFNAAKKTLNMAKVALKKVEKSGNQDAIKAAQDKLAEAQKEYMAAQTELKTAFQAKQAAGLGEEEDKDEVDSEEAVQATTDKVAATEENKQNTEATAVTKEAATVEAAKTTEYKKTNNGNGNNAAKVEKEKKDNEKRDNEKRDNEKSEHGKSGEAHGNGKKK